MEEDDFTLDTEAMIFTEAEVYVLCYALANWWEDRGIPEGYEEQAVDIQAAMAGAIGIEL